nr:Asp_protease_2 domain-containing protein [Tanacetum cinerariifolium]
MSWNGGAILWCQRTAQKIERLTTPVVMSFSLMPYITASTVKNDMRNRTAHHSGGGAILTPLVHREVLDIVEALDIENSRASSFQMRGIHVVETKVNVVRDWSSPKTLPEVRSIKVANVFQEKDELEYDEPLEGEAKQVTYAENICYMIIDGGSCENLVSKALAKAFNLPTEPHPSPYQIGQIKKGLVLMLTKICKVNVVRDRSSPKTLLEVRNNKVVNVFQEKDELEYAEHLDGEAKKVTYEKICYMIIDGESCENLVSKALVKAFNLSTEPHPSPYHIGRIKKGLVLMVIKICRVPLAMGKHYNELVSDVVDMGTYHVLLGRPWPHDVDYTWPSTDGYCKIVIFARCLSLQILPELRVFGVAALIGLW